MSIVRLYATNNEEKKDNKDNIIQFPVQKMRPPRNQTMVAMESHEDVNKIVSLLKESIQMAGIKIKDEEVSVRLLMGSILSFLYFPETDPEKIETYVNNLVLSIKA